MLTGCRPGEWSARRAGYLHLKQALLVLPADAYKSDHVRVIALVPAAVQILSDVQEKHRGERGDYVFSGTHGEKRLALVFGYAPFQATQIRRGMRQIATTIRSVQRSTHA